MQKPDWCVPFLFLIFESSQVSMNDLFQEINLIRDGFLIGTEKICFLRRLPSRKPRGHSPEAIDRTPQTPPRLNSYYVE